MSSKSKTWTVEDVCKALEKMVDMDVAEWKRSYGKGAGGAVVTRDPAGSIYDLVHAVRYNLSHTRYE